MFFLVYLKTSIMDKKENEKEREKTNKVHEMTNDAILFILNSDIIVLINRAMNNEEVKSIDLHTLVIALDPYEEHTKTLA